MLRLTSSGSSRALPNIEATILLSRISVSYHLESESFNTGGSSLPQSPFSGTRYIQKVQVRATASASGASRETGQMHILTMIFSRCGFDSKINDLRKVTSSLNLSFPTYKEVTKGHHAG